LVNAAFQTHWATRLRQRCLSSTLYSLPGETRTDPLALYFPPNFYSKKRQPKAPKKRLERRV